MITPLKRETLNAPVDFSTWRKAHEVLETALRKANPHGPAADSDMDHGLAALKQAFPEMPVPKLAAIVVRLLRVARLVSSTPVEPQITKWVTEEGNMLLPLFYAGAITLFGKEQESDGQFELDVNDLGINARHLEIWPGRFLLEQILQLDRDRET